MKTASMQHKSFVFAALSLFISSLVFAAGSGPQGVAVHGTILNAQGLPEISNNVVFTIDVRSPGSENCLLYRETQTLDMSDSNGNFSFILGYGSRSGTGFESTSSIVDVFNNAPIPLTNLQCGNGTAFTPAAGQQRHVVIAFNDGAGTHTLTQPLNVEAVPYAFNADRLQGFAPANFLNLNTTPALSQTNLESVFSPTNYPKLNTLLTSASNYLSTGTNGAVAMPTDYQDPTSLSAGQIWFNSQQNVFKYFDGTQTQTIGLESPKAVSGDAITSGTIGGSTAISTSGTIATTGSVTASRLFIYDHSGVGPGYVGLAVPSNIAASGSSYVMVLPDRPGAAGQTMVANGDGTMSWIARTTGTVTSVSAVAPLIMSGTTTAPTLSINAASTTNSGAVMLAASGGTNANTVVQATDSRLSDARIPMGTAGGDLSGSFPSPVIAKLAGTALDSTAPTSPGQILRFSGSQWSPTFISMFDLRSTTTGAQAFSGVGCTPSQTITWSSATDNLSCSTIAISDAQITNASRAAKLFLASPSSSAGAPSYRALVAADLPTGAYDTTYFKAGGNSFGAAATLGTSDANALNLQTGGVTRINISSTGSIGIGGAGRVSLDDSAQTDAIGLPSGTTAQRPITPVTGFLRYNSTNAALEIYNGATWISLATTAGAQTFSGAITMGGAGTGLTVTNNATVGGTFGVTGAATFSGTLNATGAANVGGTLAVTNNETVGGTLAVTGASTFNAATINGALTQTGVVTQNYAGTSTARTLAANAVTTAAAEAITANGLTTGSILSLSSNSTAASGSSSGLNIAISGANANASATRYGLQSSVSASGTTSTNVAGYFSATGATSNYGLLVASGNVGVGTTSPATLLDVNGAITARNTLAVTGATTLASTLGVTGATTLAATNVSNTLGVTGATTLSNTLAVTGASTLMGATTVGNNLTVAGHVISSGAAASIGTCGTSPSLAGNDTRGVATIGTGTVTSCVINFASAFASAPNCVATWSGAASAIGFGVSATTTALTVNFSSSAPGLKFNYHCVQ